MSLARFKAQNHRQQILVRGASPEVDNRATAPQAFAELHARFNFSIDVAADATNAKLARFYDVREDGLKQSWAGERVFCNPPYSDVGSWVEKAWDEHERAEIIVLLLPANRTEQSWWQKMVEPFRDRPGSALRVEFLPGRMRFIAVGSEGIGPNERPPFGVCLLIFEAGRGSQ